MESQGGTTVTPQLITAVVGVIGLITAFFWTISDFRVSMTDLTTRVTTISQRMADLEKKIIDIDVNGSRKVLAAEIELKTLEDKVKNIDEFTKDLERSLLQHHEAMVDLYKKDMADGKRDFKIGPKVPKYHLY